MVSNPDGANASTRSARGDHPLAAGRYRAAIDEVGATLRLLRYDDRDLVASYPAGTVRPVYRGATVAPWPNRIVNGRYSFAGQDFQLPVNEVDRGHALHGLVHWIRWAVGDVGADRITLEHDLVPQEGYPYAVRLTVEYALTADGLGVTVTAVNTGASAAPYGYCPHPYLVAGPGTVDDWHLRLGADLRLDTDHRLVPVGTVPVGTVDSDFRDGALVGGRHIDHAFTGLSRDRDGRATVRLSAPDGAGVQMSFGSWAPWVQIHTADRPEPDWNRAGLAVEPMTCPPDAFNSGDDLVVLEEDGRHVAEWMVSAIE